MNYSVFETALKPADGFPRPDWTFVGEWIAANVRKEKHAEAWDAAVEAWLRKTREQLGDPYAIDALDEFALLSALDQRAATIVLRHAKSAKATMLKTLSRLPLPEFLGPHVILAFAKLDEYCTYISHYYPDGEYGLAPGLCIRTGGYMHMVFAPQQADALLRAVTHELAHVVLTRFDLPLWLEEGMTQILEEVVSGYSLFRMNHEIAERHSRYWPEHGLQDYWSGKVFESADEGRELAYSLSQVLIRNLTTDHPRRFFDFVATAKRIDAGESTMREHLGMGLADCAAQFLGQGEWAPDFEKLKDSLAARDRDSP